MDMQCEEQDRKDRQPQDQTMVFADKVAILPITSSVGFQKTMEPPPGVRGQGEETEKDHEKGVAQGGLRPAFLTADVEYEEDDDEVQYVVEQMKPFDKNEKQCRFSPPAGFLI